MPRSDSLRNRAALLAAAEAVFAAEGVDVNVRAIAARAGVNTATLYRHFPLRSDLVEAVFRSEVDACAAAAPDLQTDFPPGEAAAAWIRHYATFIVSKRGLAAALHYRDPAFAGLPRYFQTRLAPALSALLDAAADAREFRAGLDPLDILSAVAKLCIPPADSDDRSRSDRMVELLIDGMRSGAASRA